jgi:electron transport complex protein RnfB
MITSYLLTLAGCALLTIVIVYLARKYFVADINVLESRIEQTLPQTQCAQCGYPGCRPYAKAIAAGEAINRCPPGGETVIEALADLLNRPVTPLADDLTPQPVPLLASIREAECIGCTLCIKACPVDAIIGSQNQMHTIIKADCTGCELCLPPCPVDCIDLLPQRSVVAQAQPRPTFSEPCIFCSACVSACPKELEPQHLLLAFDAPEHIAHQQLSACVECTLCDQACPSDLPLTETFKIMKQNEVIRAAEVAAAAATLARFEKRQQRLAVDDADLIIRPKAQDAQALIAGLKTGSKP